MAVQTRQGAMPPLPVMLACPRAAGAASRPPRYSAAVGRGCSGGLTPFGIGHS